MIHLVLRTYDFFTCRKWLLFCILLVIIALCVWSVSRIRFTEDISAFLPVKQSEKKTTNIAALNTENSLIVSVCMTDTTHAPDPDLMCEAILFFADHLQNEDSTTHHISNISYQADPEQFFTLSTWVVNNMPYLLTDSDYLRFDTLLTEEYIQRQMKENRLLLLSPAGVALRDNITHDPLRLSAPIMQRLQDLQQNQGYELYDDFIFTHGKKEGIITVESNYPVSETHGNKSLLALIENISSTTSAHFNQQVTFHTFGAADISVTNAERIRKDSLLSVSIAVILILLVLAFSIRSLRGISLMFASLLFGWLFALGILGVFKSEVSFIAVGISSIIIGIAMNYPLHLILHYRNNGRIRNTLKDLVPPLTTGNITTMAAFLSLLLVNAPAMRDMGLFAALLLLGTILFVLFVLPHGLPSRMKQPIHEDNMTGFSHKKPVIIPQYIKKIVPLLLLAVTLVLLPFSSSTTFETDMHKINYMTDQQRQDMGRYMSQFELFSNLMPDEDEQSHRLVQWQSFMQKHDETFACASQAGTKAGFTENAFDPFFHILHQEYHVKETFNAGSLLKNMVLALADDFNKVLYFCGIIVFVFLCLTLGRLELGILAFLPLAIGWIWILGIMSIAGIHFNIVNIILATLIFGQGDDYTIFITEGLMQENASGKKVLKGYRKGIVLSAIIMFVGIGALITAKHPAMRSLAEVTLVGMSVVVVMAFIVPPLIYKWLTESGGTKRRTPVTLGNFLCSIFSMIGLMICSLWATIVGFYLFTLGKSTDAKKNWYHHFIYRGMRFFQKHIPHVTVKIRGMENLPSLENNPAIIICNHQSHLDLMCIMSLYPKLIILTKEWVSRSPLYGIVTQWADFYPINEGIETLLPKLQDKVKKGYSIMIFPEGTRSDDCKIGRFHSGAFHLAQQLNLDVLPVLIHGSGHVLPKKDFMLRKGEINVEVFPAVSVNDMQPLEVARSLRRFYQQEYVRISRQVETVNYFIDTVLQNYIYKGASVAHGSHAEYKRLLKEGKLQHIDLSPTECELDVEENGYGIYSLFFALVHKETMVTAMFADPDKASLLQYCAVKPENLRIEIAKP